MKQHLLVVHGMGSHTEDSVKKEVIDAFTLAFSRYESLNEKKVSALIEVVPVSYNDVIDKYRKERATSGESIVNWLAKVNGAPKLADNVVGDVAAVEATLGADDFVNTHLLDVLLYRFTLLKHRIRLAVANKLLETMDKAGGSANVHVLGHSLGSSVLHDTLQKCYGPENVFDEEGKAANLSNSTHRLASVHMVANVSRVLESFVEVGASIVRPSTLGCTSVFVEYRHRLDPIPMPKPFNPTNNGGWIPINVWDNYRLVEPTSVTQANVHALGHYLLIPEVHLPLFELLFGFSPKKLERETGAQAHSKTTALLKAQALQAAFGDMKSDGSIRDLFAAWKSLKVLVERSGEKF